MNSMWVRVVVLSVPLAIAACAAEQEVAREATRVVIEEPRYCYRHFVGRDGIRCFKTPVHRDERHLVGYTGPPPNRYPRPEPPQPKLYAPDAVSYWVKDAELIPEPAAVPPGRRVAPPPVHKPVHKPMRKSLRKSEHEPRGIKKPYKQSSSILIEPLPSKSSNDQIGNLLDGERQAVIGAQ